MPLTCARCAAVNPDGNLYCQNCGTPLTPAAAGIVTAPIPGPPPGPPAGMAPPMFSPGGYQSPYYAPSGPQAPVHRTPWNMIIAGVVALVVVIAGGGTALALIVNHNSTPTAGSGGTATDVSSPSPAVTPTPIASPTATPGSSGTESNDGVTIPVPSGWTVQSKDTETIVLYDPSSSGAFTVASGISSPAQTAQDNKNAIDAYFKNKYPDTHACAGSTTRTGAFNGAPGIYWELCFTLTSGSSSTPAVLWVFAGANGAGDVYYLVMVSTTPDNLQNYLNEAKPVMLGLKWKLS